MSEMAVVLGSVSVLLIAFIERKWLWEKLQDAYLDLWLLYDDIFVKKEARVFLSLSEIQDAAGRFPDAPVDMDFSVPDEDDYEEDEDENEDDSDFPGFEAVSRESAQSFEAMANYDSTVEDGMVDEGEDIVRRSAAVDPVYTDGSDDLQSVLERHYPNIPAKAADNILKQLDRVAQHVNAEEDLDMDQLNFMGQRYIHFVPGTQIILGKTLNEALAKIERDMGQPRTECLLSAITFFRHWTKAQRQGRVRPLYDEYGNPTPNILVAHLGSKKANDIKDKWEPTEEEASVLSKLNFEGWVH